MRNVIIFMQTKVIADPTAKINRNDGRPAPPSITLPCPAPVFEKTHTNQKS
jgi:hypothetical protein